MFNSIFSKKGIGLIEVLISLFLISVGILALLSLQPSAWKLTSRSDHLSRAGGLLHKEMETTEILLMNPNFPNPCATTNPLVTTTNVFISGQSTAQPGDLPFTVQTTIQDNLNNSWIVRVRVTWTGNNTGISESLVVTRQENFRF
jgi:Tfp pilus assembly protein PilV